MTATAIAHSNIALVKYWGKRNERLNLPAVGSLSITLRDLYTQTSVRFDPSLQKDELFLNGRPANESERLRIAYFLDEIRRPLKESRFARIESENNFPTGAGLASSASAFAALALAATRALNLSYSPQELSILARKGSGSAARSVFGGFVEMFRGEKPDGTDSFAVQIADEKYWPLDILVAVTTEEKKAVGSTEGMKRSEETSPYYTAWVEASPADIAGMREAVIQRDFDRLAEIAEHSCLKMHGLMMATKPALIYWNAVTVEVIQAVLDLRKKGVPVFFTIDAGPQVKVICEPGYSEQVTSILRNISGVRRLIHTTVGPGAHIIEENH
ncbi:MAG: diphosphomevalonate decarboxylase [Calditrichaeota bacterium]|nr:diphosphomevalonate decarboxylase [Calditrichota bacterium]